MQAEGIIAAVLGAVTGGGGVGAFKRLIGPERDAAIAKYYREVIEGLQKENTTLRERLGRLEDRILELELARMSRRGILARRRHFQRLGFPVVGLHPPPNE